MTTVNWEKFANDYIDAWSTINPNERRNLIDKVYSSNAKFYANEPGDPAVQHLGTEKIFQNITEVNNKLVVSNHLSTELKGYSENHGILRVMWQMKTSKGEAVMSGMNFLKIDNSGKIEQDYIFIN